MVSSHFLVTFCHLLAIVQITLDLLLIRPVRSVLFLDLRSLKWKAISQVGRAELHWDPKLISLKITVPRGTELAEKSLFIIFVSLSERQCLNSDSMIYCSS